MLHNLVTAYLFVPKIVAYFMKQYLKWVGAYLHEYWHSSSLYHIRPKSTTQALTAPIPSRPTCIPHL